MRRDLREAKKQRREHLKATAQSASDIRASAAAELMPSPGTFEPGAAPAAAVPLAAMSSPVAVFPRRMSTEAGLVSDLGLRSVRKIAGACRMRGRRFRRESKRGLSTKIILNGNHKFRKR